MRAEIGVALPSYMNYLGDSKASHINYVVEMSLTKVRRALHATPTWECTAIRPNLELKPL